MGELILVNYILDKKNGRQHIEDAIEEYSNMDTIDLDKLVRCLCESLKIKMLRQAREDFIAYCKDMNWDMSVSLFLDRMESKARVYNAEHAQSWSF